MRNDRRIAEELRILRAARDGRLYRNEAGRWLIADEPPPELRARQYLAQSLRIRYAVASAVLTERGLAMLDDHEATT